MLFEEPERHLNFLFDQVSVRKKEKPNGNFGRGPGGEFHITNHHFGAVNHSRLEAMTEKQHEI